jgi:biotin carboxyl carrier protein
VPDARQKPDRAEPRTRQARAADHAAIDRLADQLVPALAAKLGATGLGEIEVREDGWKLRVQRPPEGPNLGRRSTDKISRAQPGHAGHGHAPAALEGHRTVRPAAAAAAHSTNGSGPPMDHPPSPPPETSDSGRRRRDRGDSDPYRAIATSPAVGVYQPKSGLSAGTRVRAGDRVGVVDVLGVPEDVVAPADGVVGASLVEPGEAVEYGQELLVVEIMTSTPGLGGTAGPAGSAEDGARG